MQPITSIKTRGHRRRRLAKSILAWHSKNLNPMSTSQSNSVRVVCISDTHNTQPVLPPGDILIHAGDLTDCGSFDEVQAGITWLSSQPHRFKIFVAGNHDVLLDEAFLQKHPERRYGQPQTKKSLDWGSVIYLEDSSITLDVPLTHPPLPGDSTPEQQQPEPTGTRRITIFGSPWSPRYGTSAFQYPPTTGADHWAQRNLSELNPDIVVTHGPPKLYLDRRDIHQAGCPYLLTEIARLRPRLHVFGHIHAAYGREEVVMDAVRRAHDEVVIGWGGWGVVAWMVVLALWGRVKGVVGRGRSGGGRSTTFVNAAVVGGRGNELRNGAVFVEV